jgi:S-adenosylmethionine decarboxylase proenzyme
MASESNGTSVPVEQQKPYIVRVSKRFIYLSLITSTLLAFTIGRAARIILIEGPRQALLAPHDSSAMFVRPEHSRPSLPNPQSIEGKEVPKTLYTAQTFDIANGALSSSAYLERGGGITKDGNADASSFCNADGDGKQQCMRGVATEDKVVNDGAEADDDEHLPAGQHLLIDIKNVDGTFLNSEVRLAEAMIRVVSESKLTLLSYHCHKLIPMGVSCVGVLLESHISFHTWPEEGVITLDLFTCGSGELIPVLPIVKRLFAIPIEGGEADMPLTVWTHKLRGFSTKDSYLGDDLGKFVLEKTSMDFKAAVSAKNREKSIHYIFRLQLFTNFDLCRLQIPKPSSRELIFMIVSMRAGAEIISLIPKVSPQMGRTNLFTPNFSYPSVKFIWMEFYNLLGTEMNHIMKHLCTRLYLLIPILSGLELLAVEREQH